MILVGISAEDKDFAGDFCCQHGNAEWIKQIERQSVRNEPIYIPTG